MCISVTAGWPGSVMQESSTSVVCRLCCHPRADAHTSKAANIIQLARATCQQGQPLMLYRNVHSWRPVE